jgi:hypothetical protein
MTATVTGPIAGERFAITLADGESREAECDPYGSYSCPFCAGVVVSPEGWADNAVANMVWYAREGERPYIMTSYPSYFQEVWERRQCGNPFCLVSMDMTVLAAQRAKRAAAEVERQREADRARFHAEYLEHSRQCEAEQWAAAKAHAEDMGACIACLHHSQWRDFGAQYNPPERPHGRARFVRHRGPCPNAPAERPRSARYA